MGDPEALLTPTLGIAKPLLRSAAAQGLQVQESICHNRKNPSTLGSPTAVLQGGLGGQNHECVAKLQCALANTLVPFSTPEDARGASASDARKKRAFPKTSPFTS